MGWEPRFNDLIDAAWRVLDTDYDEAAFQVWRNKAVEFVALLRGFGDESAKRAKCRECGETYSVEWTRSKAV